MEFFWSPLCCCRSSFSRDAYGAAAAGGAPAGGGVTPSAGGGGCAAGGSVGRAGRRVRARAGELQASPVLPSQLSTAALHL